MRGHGRAVARTHQELIELGVVDDGVPRRAATAEFPPIAAPGFGRRFQFRMLEAEFRVAGDHEEAPRQLAGVGVVGGQVAAQPPLRTALADEHLARHGPHGTRDGVGAVRRVVASIHVPDLLARGLVDGDEAGVEGREIDAALVGREAPIDGAAAAGVAHRTAIGLGVEAPDLLAGGRVEGVGDAPRVREVEDAIDHQGRRLHPVAVAQVLVPREAQAADGFTVDVREPREPQLLVGLAVGQPTARFICGGEHAFLVDPARAAWLDHRTGHGRFHLGRDSLASRLGPATGKCHQAEEQTYAELCRANGVRTEQLQLTSSVVPSLDSGSILLRSEPDAAGGMVTRFMQPRRHGSYAMDLADKHTIITGGASGIGAATAREFARLGARVVVADINADGAREVADEIGGTAVRCNVADEGDVNALVADATRAYGPVDLFFSNAGVATGGDPLETPIDVWNEQWQINVMAHVFAVRAVLPSMLERESGYLLHTASMAGILTTHGNLTYAATKHAVVGLAEWLSITYHDKGDTDILARALRRQHADARQFGARLRPQRRRAGQGARGRGAHGRRGGIRGTVPDSHRRDRRDLDEPQGERPRALAERHAPAAIADRGGSRVAAC